jgi:hypothetical protein
MNDTRRTAMANAARQKRYRDRRRDGVPTEAEVDREVSRVVFANVGNAGFRPADATSQARSHLLQKFTFSGINRVIVQLGARK